ncbi:DUF3817 domain-containing protein [soil metagenome]
MSFSKTSLGRLRWIGIAEGISFLILLFVAMPLKYLGGIPEAVKYTGWMHGILFIMYIYALISVYIDYKWTIKRTAIGFIASLLPFGTFVLDKQLKQDEAALKLK